MTILEIDKKMGNYDIFEVITEVYHDCDLFEKVSHKGTKSTTAVFLYFKSTTLIGNYSNYRFYDSIPLEKIEVYYSKFEPEQFLVVVIYLSRIAKYFTYSRLNGFNRRGSLDGPVLSGNKLLDVLLDENYRTNSTITYRLDLKDSNIDSNVKVQKFEKDPFACFIKYTHIPTDGNKKSVILLSDMLIASNKVPEIQNKKYNCVTAYYLMNEYEDPFPSLIILNDNQSGNIYLKIKDTLIQGWEEISFPPSFDPSNENKIEYILKQVHYKEKKSIMILLHKTNGQYEVELIDNEGDDEKDSLKLSQYIMIREQTSSSFYKCYKHDLKKLSEMEQNKDIFGLRLFLPNSQTDDDYIEVKLKDQSENQHLYYIKDVDGPCVYFYKNNSSVDTVPLLLYYFNKWYAPYSKNSYFTDWKEITGISGTTDTSGIKRQLDNVNNILNQIDIREISSYGITHSGLSIFEHEGFNSKRVNIVRERLENKYRMVKHSTLNKGTFRDIVHGGSFLSGTSSSHYSSSNPNQVVLYYHESDQEHKMILLISVGSDSSNHTVFYERVSKEMSYEFKKCEPQLSLEGDRLTEKTNSLYYKFNKSLVIKLDQSTGNYTPKLIDNSHGGRQEETAPNVNVTDDGSCIDGSNYKCRKHDITLIDRSNVGGFRISINDKEIQTYDKSTSILQPLYYRSDQLFFQVYFDDMDVPLMFKYNGQYYCPNSINEYFTKWRLIDVEEIVTKLDEINKNLNRIDISATSGEYGIPKQKQHVGLHENSYNRIQITRNDNGSNYRKVTQTTKNSFSVGQITFKGTVLGDVQSYLTPMVSQVDVYYAADDSAYKHPLLIRFGTQNGVESDICFKRGNIEGTLWERVFDSDSIATPERILEQLNELKRNLFKTVCIMLEKNENYETSSEFSNVERPSVTYNSQITVDKFGHTVYTHKEYRSHEHKITDYYESNTSIFSSSGSEIKFEIIPEISGNEINVYDKDDAPYPLYYNSDSLKYRRNLFVYFYKGDKYEVNDDTVPMLFEYENKFYAPAIISDYFTKWKELQIEVTENDLNGPLGKHLDRLNRMFNSIDLSQKLSYGLSKPSHNVNNFKTIRIIVKNEPNAKYNKVAHSTLNGYNIGDIKYNGHSFEDYSDEVEEKINEVVVITKRDQGYKEPKLVLVNNKYGSNSDTYGYYDLTEEVDGGKYKFTGLDVPQSLDGINLDSIERIDRKLGQAFKKIISPTVVQTGDQQPDHVHHNGMIILPSLTSPEHTSSVDESTDGSQENSVQSSGTPVLRSDQSDAITRSSMPPLSEVGNIAESDSATPSEPVVPSSPTKSKGQPSLTENNPSTQQPPLTDESSGVSDTESTGGTRPNENNLNKPLDVIITFLKENVAAVSGGAVGSVVLTGASGYGIYRGCIKVK